MKPPCRGCSIRSPTCHAECERYRIFNEANELKREKRRIENAGKFLAHDVKRKSVEKAMKKHCK